MKKNIFVALDFSNFDKAVDVAEQVKNDAAGLKITNELFAICGKEKYLTVHTSGNCEMLKSAQDTGLVELLGVTVLTSQSNLEGVGIKNSIKDQIKILVNLAIHS